MFTKDEQKDFNIFLQNGEILKIIELGDNIFRGKDTGDIIILVARSCFIEDRRIITPPYAVEEDYKIKVLDLSFLSSADNYKKVIKGNGYKLTENGEKLFNEANEEEILLSEYLKRNTKGGFDIVKNATMFKDIIIKQLTADFNKMFAHGYLTNREKYLLDLLLQNRIKNINSISVRELILQTQMEFGKFRLGDKFKLVKKNVNYNYKTQRKKQNGDNIPLFACKKNDNGVACYVDKEEYEGDVIVIVHHRDATCGYANHYKGKLAWNNSCYVIEEIDKNEKIDLDYIAEYITCYLSPEHVDKDTFTAEFLLNVEIINRLYLSDVINEDSLYKVRLMDYFEIVKNKCVVLNKLNPGPYPVYGASNSFEPAEMSDSYEIDINDDTVLTLSKNGSVGYCFPRNGKFSITTDLIVLQVKEKFKETLDLKINAKLITLQISNMGFGFNNKINQAKLNNINLYLSFIEPPPQEFEE